MAKVFVGLLSFVILSFPTIASAEFINTLDIYQIGNTGTGPVTLSWFHVYDGSAATETAASLTIVAEGVDEGLNAAGISLRENDQVYFNGNLLGLLDDQNFYAPTFDIKPGPGALGFPQTALSTTTFNLNPAWLVVGNNLVQVVVDPGNWIVEAETSTLRVTGVPEPASAVLLGMSLLGLACGRRRTSAV